MNTTIDASPNGARERIRRGIEHPRVQQAIMALIIVNAIILGLETVPGVMADWGPLLIGIDRVILGVFVIEVALRVVGHGLRFFRDPWSLFDFVVVGIALVPASGPFAVLRALRVLRVLRLLTLVPSMRRVVGALLSSIPGLSSIAAVLMILFYVFAVIATNLYGATHPQWFGTIGESLYTLFQVMTLESWSMGIVRPVMQEHPSAWAFFVVFILIATFTMLNLFIAIIVNAMHTFTEEESERTTSTVADARDHIEADMHAELAALRAEIVALRDELRR